RLWSGTARKVRPSDSVPPAHGFLLIAPTHVDKSSDDIHNLSTAGRRRNRRPGIQRQGQGAKTMSFHELTKSQNAGRGWRRLLAAASASAIAAGLASASALAQDKAQGGTQDKAPLHCSIDPTFAPHAMVNLKGELEGFQIDLFTEVARRLGREINIEPMAHAGEFPALASKRIDF